ncbi:MAG: prolyl oligopeptidase family serine peptidase [Bacillota bacterium]
MLRKLLLGLALCTAAPTIFADSSAAVPAEAFFTYAKVSAAKISPDGKYLAMAVANEKTGLEKNILAIVSLSDMKAKASFWLKGDQSVLNFWWANDERVLVATATQTGSFDSPLPDGDLYAINVDGTKKRQLLPYHPEEQNTHMQRSVNTDVYYGGLIYLDPDRDPKHVLFKGNIREGSYYRQTPKAYKLDIYTGDIRQVAQGDEATGSLMADQDGNIRMTWGDDGDGHAVLFYRADGDSFDWKNLSTLYRGEDPAQVESRVVGFAPDEKHFYWLGRTKDSTMGLYLVDPDTLEKKPLFEDANFDINGWDFNFDEDGVVWSFKDDKGMRSLVAVQTMPGLPQLHVIDSSDLKAQYLTALYQAFDGQEVEITSATRDHSILMLLVSSDRNPGDFYLFDTKTNKANFLFASKPEIDPDTMPSMMPITFTARDGVVLHGYLTLPPSSSGKNLPLIVNPHGGPHTIRDVWGFSSIYPEPQFFASHGYAVLQLNYRGSGGYGLKLQQLGYRHWSSTMQDDLADGVAWAIKQGYADPNRVCIYGASYGGYAAFENPIRYPNLYKCAVGYVGAYDLTLLGEEGDVSHFAGGVHAMDVYLGTDMEERKRESPAYNADKLKLPLFIIYGGADFRVVPDHAKNMMAALDKADIKYELMYEPNEGHGFRNQDHVIELYKRLLAFFDKYIGPDAAKPPSDTAKSGNSH